MVAFKLTKERQKHPLDGEGMSDCVIHTRVVSSKAFPSMVTQEAEFQCEQEKADPSSKTSSELPTSVLSSMQTLTILSLGT